MYMLLSENRVLTTKGTFKFVIILTATLLCSCKPSASRHASLADQAADAGDVNLAIQHLDEAIRLDPASLDYREERAARLAWAGRYEEAQRDFVIACDLKARKNAYCLFTKGINEGHLGLYAQALSDFDQAIAQEPENGQYYYGRALAQMMLGQLDSALSSVDRAVNLGNACEWRYLRALILSRLGRRQLAIEQFNSSSCFSISGTQDVMFKGEREFQRSKDFSEQDLRMLWGGRGLPPVVIREYEDDIVEGRR